MVRGKSYWLPRLLAPGVLLGVALIHAVLVTQYGLTPWKGGGFGMFSTVDSTAARSLRISVLARVRGQLIFAPVKAPSQLSGEARRLRALPQRSAALAFAKELADLDWAIHVDDLPRVLDGELAAPMVSMPDPESANSDKQLQPPRIRPRASFRKERIGARAKLLKVRVEVRRLQVDAFTHRLSSEKLLAVAYED